MREERLRDPSASQLLCKTLVTAISPGTEIAAWRGLPHLRPGISFPRLMGYCNVSQVEAVGTEVLDIKVGDRILSFTSHRSHALLTQDDILLKLNPDHDAGRIATTYLFHLGYDAVMRSDIRPGSRVLVIGMGAIGLASVAMAHFAGASVCGLTEFEVNAKRAKAMGAEFVVGRADVNALADCWGGSSADVVISTTNQWADWRFALEAVGQMGLISCIGFPGRGEPPPDFNPLATEFFHAKQLRLEAVGMPPSRLDVRGLLRFTERSNIAWLAGLIACGKLNPDILISGKYPAANLERAYTDLVARKNAPITYLLEW